MGIFENAIIRGIEKIMPLFEQPERHIEDIDSGTPIGTVSSQYYPDRHEGACISWTDRLSHVYAIGGTNSGKTSFIEGLIRNDFMNGVGNICIDFHGDLSESLLGFLAQQYYPHYLDELGQRLILIEPFNTNWAVGCNILHTAGESFGASLEIGEVFEKCWGNNSWGPRMTELLRTVLFTLSANDLTLLEAGHLLTNESFRNAAIDNIDLREIRDYWLCRFNPLSEKMKSVYREPVLNRISAFVTDPAIYRMIGQRERAINFRQAMDDGKWIILNLSKGRVRGNLRLLALLFITKIKQEAFSRTDIPEHQRRPFHVYLDELQNINFFSDDVETILSECRKVKLGLTMAHQNLDQLSRDLRSSILTNCGTKLFFRLSHSDASQVSSEMDHNNKVLIERKLVDLKTAEAYFKIRGQQPRLLKVQYLPPARVSEKAISAVKISSFQYWATPVVEIENEIEERRRQLSDMDEQFTDCAEQSFMFSEEYGNSVRDNMYEEGQNEW